MRGREAQQLCMFMSCTALIFVLFLYFQKSREGLENKKEAKKVAKKVEKEANAFMTHFRLVQLLWQVAGVYYLKGSMISQGRGSGGGGDQE